MVPLRSSLRVFYELSMIDSVCIQRMLLNFELGGLETPIQSIGFQSFACIYTHIYTHIHTSIIIVEPIE
jgi:hypothetical protein